MSQKQPSEFRIDTILSAAVEEFLQKGYEGASVDSIAKRAGVSKGCIYYHFPNKETILMQANIKLSEPVAQMVERASANISAVNGLRQYISDYIQYWIDKPKEMSFFLLSMSKALESPLLIDYYREYLNQVTAFFVSMFVKAAELGELEIDDPKAYGICLMGALDSVVSYTMVNAEDPIEVLTERFEKIWLKGKGA